MINKVIKKAALRFRISVYEKAICGNHLHILVRGKTRFEIQNFFRVVKNYIVQNTLEAMGVIPYQPRYSRYAVPSG
ncbi:hypothetical protein CIK05_02865 [Bdellovibrio sp. qaytius]|nr:hypothetical protein CIK05_02865 [Bdellovibrio sp. qaytius]